ncbi:thiol-disulfide oxidoreductase DCC family protein [Muriicola sp. Z0-33]|uniref:thiol-disulfide oxidoreductase DCC family protein n=1 Tax=Muriicola sp. Z0-33 TaxID=2816957 RepID=UPI0022380A3B|nr:thiol-disulfide oxidoreductase DCC family protein [Muriicola sp. Z0-33]MCW5515336.1 DUF393 domain-containing protein [Muriicola sp. Z0-33]
MNIPENKQLILFDGICNLCNNAVQYVIKRDKRNRFCFAPLQGSTGQQFIKERGIDTSKIDSIILVDPNVAYYVKSTAALKIGQQFGGGYRLLAVLEWIPSPFRDWIYDLVAKRRYRWFGKKDACMVPTPELKVKFMD